MSDQTKPFEEKMKKSILSLESDLSTVRVGRANPHVLDRLSIDYYGQQTPINQVGNISVPEPRILQIQPWDASILKLIEKSIQQSDIGINPSNDGKVIRMIFPELTEERRKDLSKEVKKKGEETKVAIRNIRRDGVDSFKKAEKKSDISEDDLRDLEKEIQDITDKKIEEINKVVELKIKEVMSI